MNGFEIEQAPTTPTMAQWARAEALKAVMATDTSRIGIRQVAEQVLIFAELIETGELPPPAPGSFY